VSDMPKFNDERSETAFWQIIHYDRAKPDIDRITNLISNNLDLFGARIGGDALRFTADFLERYVADRRREEKNPVVNVRKTKRGLFVTVHVPKRIYNKTGGGEE
jgi:hypothetical protein